MLTEDGSHTILVPEMGEHYHSVHGAIQESRHIFINHGYHRTRFQPLRILEVGFGTGLNAFLTLLESNAVGRIVHYESWEAYPIPSPEAQLLNYPAQLQANPSVFRDLHDAEWGKEVWLTDQFRLTKIEGDIRQFSSDKQYDLIYFDAFGPDFQPELWVTEVFSDLATRLATGAILVTYSAKGQIRRNLREAGFLVEKAPGPPGKREITVAIKK
jgi:tRNA U34 5-methylaminomethyl-2-thiouridine-forming methyltransferase MnmC